MNTWEDLEPVTIRALREHLFYKEISILTVYPIGLLIRGTETVTKIGVECLTFLDEQPSESVLFVALGSGGSLTAEQNVELA